MRRYHTGLIVVDREDFPSFPYKGHRWVAHLSPADRSLAGSPNVGRFNKRGRLSFDKKPELILEAPNEVAARRAFDLIQASHDVINASIYQSGPAAYSGGPCLIDEEKVKELLRRPQNECHRPWASYSDIPWACLIAAKASRRLKYIYSIFKWQLSASTFSVHYDQLHPSKTAMMSNSDYPDHHIKFASAIVLAYSAIEELGLDIRASTRNPSSKDGVWNPPVLEDLESRLRSGGMNLDELFCWNVRGSKTRLEKDKPKQAKMPSKRAPWSRWSVRDQQVYLADAIAHASWLRSRVSSHKLNYSLVRVLSVYDGIRSHPGVESRR